MNVEIERRFVLTDVPAPDVLADGVHIQQGYLAQEDDAAVRVRFTDDTAVLTVKVGAGISRTEVELDLSLDQAEALWPHTAGRRVEKVRYRVVLDASNDLVAEVDVYAGPLAGLCTADVEFPSEDDANAFSPYAWMGREVTGDAAWSNAALARHGRPD